MQCLSNAREHTPGQSRTGKSGQVRWVNSPFATSNSMVVDHGTDGWTDAYIYPFQPPREYVCISFPLSSSHQHPATTYRPPPTRVLFPAKPPSSSSKFIISRWKKKKDLHWCLFLDPRFNLPADLSVYPSPDRESTLLAHFLCLCLVLYYLSLCTSVCLCLCLSFCLLFFCLSVSLRDYVVTGCPKNLVKFQKEHLKTVSRWLFPLKKRSDT